MTCHCSPFHRQSEFTRVEPESLQSNPVSDDPFQSRLKVALENATAELLAQRNAQGHWVGELSSSALSTATAVTALAVVQRASATIHFKSPITSGLDWLAQNQNADGGWGDTVLSHSNLSTTVLCWAAFGAAGEDEKYSWVISDAEDWLANHIRSDDSAHPSLNRSAGVPPAETFERDDVSNFSRPPDERTPRRARRPRSGGDERFSMDELARTVIARYGKDRTFSVPILTMCALAGRLGEGREAWRQVIPLPFELAAFPHQLFAALRLPVVSYALPALIAIGQARHVHRPTRNPFTRLLRNFTRERTLKILEKIQPRNGGFLEATPLTSFVTMSLAGSGQADHPVTKRGVKFLRASQRPDGSWPIDTNLATWLTTLAVGVLPANVGSSRREEAHFSPPINQSLLTSAATKEMMAQPSALLGWLLGQQYWVEHPYTHAAPGGWAWTDLPGGVPDADDTAGALLALEKMRNAECGMRNGGKDEILDAAEAGVRWLLDLQNSDGGIPTFCRGWGALPFDRSSADITAHVLRAWAAWSGELPRELQARVARATRRALKFLCRTQRADGSWMPLWFGNQFEPHEENPTYGTARVLHALAELRGRTGADWEPAAVSRGARWLLGAQNEDGSWGGFQGGPASVEETALAVEALACLDRKSVV